MGVGVQGDGQMEDRQQHPAEYRRLHAHGQERIDDIDEEHSPPDALGSVVQLEQKQAHHLDGQHHGDEHLEGQAHVVLVEGGVVAEHSHDEDHTHSGH